MNYSYFSKIKEIVPLISARKLATKKYFLDKQENLFSQRQIIKEKVSNVMRRENFPKTKDVTEETFTSC